MAEANNINVPVPGQNVHDEFDCVPELSDLENVFAHEDELSPRFGRSKYPLLNNSLLKKEILLSRATRYQDTNEITSDEGFKSTDEMEDSDISTSSPTSNANINAKRSFRSSFVRPETFQSPRVKPTLQHNLAETRQSPVIKAQKLSQLQKQFQLEKSQRLKNSKINHQFQSTEASIPEQDIYIPTNAILDTFSPPRRVSDNGEVKKLYKVGDKYVLMSSKERRRERNKALARKTREKKKEELETLRDMIHSLETENLTLRVQLSTKKAMVFERLLPEQEQNKELSTTEYKHNNGNQDVDGSFDNIMSPIAHLYFQKLAKSLKDSQSFCITNIKNEKNPIVYASSSFACLTGYSVHETLGRNCRFLQGKETNSDDVRKISEAIHEGKDLRIALINYKKNGSKFWNRIELFAIKDSLGAPTLFVGFQTEISEEEAILIHSSSNSL